MEAIDAAKAGVDLKIRISAKTSILDASCARAVAPRNESTAKRDTTNFHFINLP